MESKRKHTQYALLLATALLSFISASNAIAPPTSIAPHPRLLSFARSTQLRNSTDAFAINFRSLLFTHADWVRTQPVVPHGTPGASGILDAVRRALDYMLTCALAHRLDMNGSSTVYLDRAVNEALNLASTWSDWNCVQHALDTGEALLAVGLTYDWLYPFISDDVRGQLLTGIVNKGLLPYQTYMTNKTVFWWINNTINWNCGASTSWSRQLAEASVCANAVVSALLIHY